MVLINKTLLKKQEKPPEEIGYWLCDVCAARGSYRYAGQIHGVPPRQCDSCKWGYFNHGPHWSIKKYTKPNQGGASSGGQLTLT